FRDLWKAATSGDFNAMGKAWEEAGRKFKENSVNFNNQFIDIWTTQRDFVQNMLGPRAPFTLRHEKDKDFQPDLSKTKEDTVLERIKERFAALDREAAEWLKVGAAGSQAAAMIAEANKKGADEYGKLREQAAKSKSPAALDFVTSHET